MASLWQLFVSIGGDSTGYKTAIKGAQADTVQFGATTETVASRVSASFSKLAGSIGFAAIGAGALAAASKFQEAGAQIARSTGATGDQLKALETSFTNVYKKTAAGSTDVATVLSMLSTRTQATGKDLEDLTLKTIKLAKTQREDVTQIVPLVTRVFGDWSIASNRQAKAMDYLRVASQQTGTTVSRLAEQAVYAGAPLRQLGFTFEQATVLIGKFEKEGVNTELVLGGMKAALQKFAKEGITDTAAAWKKFVEGVKAGNISFKEVAEEVGVKRAVDLYKAIQEGRFEIDAMVNSTTDLAAKGGANVETFKTKIVKLQHELETLVSGHYQLITAVGLTYPLWSKLLPLITGLVSGASVALVSRLVPAVAETTAATVVLGSTWTATGATMTGAITTATAATSTLASTLTGIGVILVGLIAGWKAWQNVQKDIKPLDTKRPEGALGERFSFHGFYAMPLPAPSAPSAVYGPAVPDGFNPDAPAGGGGSGVAKIGKEAEQAAEKFRKLRDEMVRFRHVAAEGLGGGGATIEQLRALPLVNSATALADMPSYNRNAALARDILGAQATEAALAARNVGILTDAYHALGITSTAVLREQYEAALEAARAMVTNGAGVNDVGAAMERVAEAHKKLSQRTTDWTKKTVDARKELNEFQRQIDRSFNALARGIAKSIVEWKGFGATLKEIAKDTATSFLEIMIRQLIKPLEDQFAKLAGALGKALGIGGGAAQKAGTGGGWFDGWGGGGSKPAGSAAGGAGGIMGTIGAVSAAVGAVSSVIGNFQFAGMNKSLDVLVNHTLRIYNELAQFRADAWTREAHWYARTSDMWQSIIDVKDAITRGGGGAGRGGINFTNCSFTGSPNEIASAIFTQAQLAGAI
jgi:hypothetical protein